ncbi:MAG: cupin domain-containing protein [Anaerolineae bacterium]
MSAGCIKTASSHSSRRGMGFVIQGQLTVTVGEETFVLKAGDSIHYEMLQPHSWRNEGDEEGIAIWAVSPPIPDGDLGG